MNCLQTSNGNFKQAAWNGCADAVAPLMPEDQLITGDKCANRYRNYFKKTWKLWEQFTRLSGWTYNATKGTIESSHAVMEEYFRTHPDMQQFQEGGPAFKEELQQLLRGHLTTLEHGTDSPSVRQQQEGSNQEGSSRGLLWMRLLPGVCWHVLFHSFSFYYFLFHFIILFNT